MIYIRGKIKGSTQGVVADTAGRFLLKEVQTPTVLAFSSIGYISQELYLAPGQGEVNILMNVQMLTGTLGTVSVVTVKSSRPKTKSAKELFVAAPASMSVYPNPLQANQALKLNWQGLESGNYLIQVYNVSGALMNSKKIKIEKWAKDYILDSHGLVTGKHFVRLAHVKTPKRLTEQIVVRD